MMMCKSNTLGNVRTFEQKKWRHHLTLFVVGLVFSYIYFGPLLPLVLAPFLLKQTWITAIRESVTVINSTGIQIRRYNPFGVCLRTKFIPAENIKGLVINETIIQQRVVPYLAVIFTIPDRKGRRIFPLFRGMTQRLSVLRKIYSDSFPMISPSTYQYGYDDEDDDENDSCDIS